MCVHVHVNWSKIYTVYTLKCSLMPWTNMSIMCGRNMYFLGFSNAFIYLLNCVTFPCGWTHSAKCIICKWHIAAVCRITSLCSVYLSPLFLSIYSHIMCLSGNFTIIKLHFKLVIISCNNNSFNNNNSFKNLSS